VTAKRKHGRQATVALGADTQRASGGADPRGQAVQTRATRRAPALRPAATAARAPATVALGADTQRASGGADPRGQAVQTRATRRAPALRPAATAARAPATAARPARWPTKHSATIAGGQPSPPANAGGATSTASHGRHSRSGRAAQSTSAVGIEKR